MMGDRKDGSVYVCVCVWGGGIERQKGWEAEEEAVTDEASRLAINSEDFICPKCSVRSLSALPLCAVNALRTPVEDCARQRLPPNT